MSAQNPQTLSTIQAADGTERSIHSIVYSIAQPSHNSGGKSAQTKTKKTTTADDDDDGGGEGVHEQEPINPFAIRTNDTRDNHPTSNGIRSTRTKKGSNKTKKSSFNDHDSTNSSSSPNNNLSTLTDLYGLTSAQLTTERNAIQIALDHDELSLANQVEQNLAQISSLISTFQSHILTQSETIDTIYKDVEVVNHNITSGNDQLTEALERGGWGAKFYAYVFLLAAIALFVFDWLLN